MSFKTDATGIRLNNNYLLIQYRGYSYIFNEREQTINRFDTNEELVALGVTDLNAYIKKLKQIKPITEIEELATNKTVIRYFNANDSKPILEPKQHSKADTILIKNCEDLQSYYNICINKSNKKKYYYNPYTNKYEELDLNTLGLLLKDEYGIILFDYELTRMLQLFRISQEPKDDYINFNNCCLNTNTFEITTDEKIFTTKNIPYNYIPNPKDCKQGTIVEKTLKQILIPADNPTDDSLYIDCLQRIGASFKRENIHKKGTLYLGTGNNGRGILKRIIETIFKALAVTVRPEKLKDDFFKVNLGSTNIIVMDELDKNSFNNATVLANLKDITGRGSEQTRNMREQEVITVKNYGMLWLFSNVAPSVAFNQIAYWRRMDLLTLPNTFEENIKEDKPKQRIYKANPYLDDAIAKDTDGIEWLISESIYQYKQMIEQGQDFARSQTVEQSQFAFDGKDPLRVFIESFVMQTNNKDDKLSNKIICYHFLQWCINNDVKDLDATSYQELTRNIGNKLNNLFNQLDVVKINGLKHYKGLSLNIDSEVLELEDIDNVYFNELIDSIFN